MTVEFRELTFRGRGAISVIGVRGKDADHCIASCFRPMNGRQYTELCDRPIVYGTWQSTNEDLIVVRKAPQSFEIQCHGSLAAVESIKEDLVSLDAIEACDASEWGDGKNSHQYEIASALQNCKTKRCAEHLLHQLRIWENAELLTSDERQRALAFSTFGVRLSGQWTIVLCGRPNVGKSSLINVLAGFERAIVHETAGTTRDLVSQQTAIDGWPVELIDSAGIRETDSDIEQAGISRARKVIESADLVIHIVDANSSDDFDPSISQNRAGLIVFNKIDLGNASRIENAGCPIIHVSAKTGEGFDQLLTAISSALVPEIPTSGQLVPVSQNQIKFLGG